MESVKSEAGELSTASSPTGGKRFIALCLLSLLILLLILAVVSKWQPLIELQVDRFEGIAPQGPIEDYVAYYTAGDFILHGRGESLYDLEAIADRQHEIMGRGVGGTGRLGFFNPPFVAVMFAPLALLPIDIAAPLLLLINVGLTVIAGTILHRALGLRSLLLSVAYWLAILSLFSVYWVLVHGQLSVFVLLGFLGFFALQRQGHTRLSGVPLALLLIKPQMAILPVIVLLYRRRWSELTSFSAVAGLLAVISIVASGPSVLWEYPSFALNAGEWEETFAWEVERMYGLNGLLAAVTDEHGTAHFVVTGVSSIAAAVLAISAFKGSWEPRGKTFPLALGSVIAATVLINPHVWMQDMVLVGLVAALGLVGWQAREKTAPIWLCIAILVWVSQWVSFRLEVLYALNVQTPLLIATFLLLLWEIRELRKQVQSRNGANAVHGEEIAAA